MPKIDSLNICPGHPDEHFVRMAASREGNFYRASGELSAYLDKSGTFYLNGNRYKETVRSCKCQLLINGIKCSECSNYRDTLRAIYHRWFKQQNQSPNQHTSTHSHTNERWLTKTQQDTKTSKLKTRLKHSCQKINYLKQKIEEAHNKFAITVDDGLHGGLLQIMNNHSARGIRRIVFVAYFGKNKH